MRITVNVFFKSIVIRNKHIIPEKGPLMVLANHPSTFMDPIVIASILNRKVFFLAKGELFKSAFAKWMLPKLNMIPVYRKQDDPSQMNKNDDTFIKCFEHLEKGGAILMFPEGISITDRKLKPIKTGASRIVLGAEARNDFNLGVKIVTIGLNYANPHRFNQDLFINIHEPIDVAKYKENYSNDSFEAAHLLTAEITNHLETIVIAIEDEKTDELVQNIETLYKHKLFKARGISSDDKEADFEITKNIVKIVNYYRLTQSDRVKNVYDKILAYNNKLNNIKLNNSDLSNENHRSFIMDAFFSLLIIVFGFPFFLYGTLNNILPFEIPFFLAKKITKTKEFIGAISMVLGTLFFIIFYSIQIGLVWNYTHYFGLTLIYAASLPITGFFAYWYYRTVSSIKTKWYLMMLFYKKSSLVSELINERNQLIAEFEKARNEYDETMS